jgi:hypothetical protein
MSCCCCTCCRFCCCCACCNICVIAPVVVPTAAALVTIFVAGLSGVDNIVAERPGLMIEGCLQQNPAEVGCIGSKGC